MCLSAELETSAQAQACLTLRMGKPGLGAIRCEVTDREQNSGVLADSPRFTAQQWGFEDSGSQT